jgi:tetratricopeptide (TPR) repeat protein
MEQIRQNEALVLDESRLLLEGGDDAGASAVLEAHLNTYPDSKNVMRALAKIRMRQHHPDQAAHLFERALGRSRDDVAGGSSLHSEHAHIEHGHRSLLNPGENLEASDLLEGYVTGYLKSYPNSKNGLRALAKIKMLQHRPDEAAQLFERALGIVRNHFVAAKASHESLGNDAVPVPEHDESNEPQVASIALMTLLDALSHSEPTGNESQVGEASAGSAV